MADDDLESRLGQLESEALRHLEAGDCEASLAAMDTLLELDQARIAAHMAMQYAFLVGFIEDAPRYDRALLHLGRWDERAFEELGRPFSKPFAGHAGLAMILHAQGNGAEAIEPARQALEQGVASHGPIPGHPELGKVGPLPEKLLHRLIVIADMWDEAELGPKPRS